MPRIRYLKPEFFFDEELCAWDRIVESRRHRPEKIHVAVQPRLDYKQKAAGGESPSDDEQRNSSDDT